MSSTTFAGYDNGFRARGGFRWSAPYTLLGLYSGVLIGDRHVGEGQALVRDGEVLIRVVWRQAGRVPNLGPATMFNFCHVLFHWLLVWLRQKVQAQLLQA